MNTIIPRIHDKSETIQIPVLSGIKMSDVRFSMIRKNKGHALVITTPVSQDIFPVEKGKNDNMKYHIENGMLIVEKSAA